MDIEETGIPEEILECWSELRRLSASLKELPPEEIRQITGKIAAIRDQIEKAGYDPKELLKMENKNGL